MPVATLCSTPTFERPPRPAATSHFRPLHLGMDACCVVTGWRPPQERNHQPATSAATIINDRLSHVVILFPGEPAVISVYDSSCDDDAHGHKVLLASFSQPT